MPHRKERRGVGGVFFDNLKYKEHLDSLNLLECLGKEYTKPIAKSLKEEQREIFERSKIISANKERQICRV